MMIYKIALFLHVAGVFAIIAAFTLEAVGLAQLRSARTAEQARESMRITGTVRMLGPVSFVLLLVPGIYMAATTWPGARWPWIGLAAMVILPALGAPSGIRTARVQKTLATESGPLGAAIQQQINDPFLQLSMRIRLATLVGIAYLMTMKPGLAGSLTAIGAAIVIGAASSVVGRHAEPASNETATA